MDPTDQSPEEVYSVWALPPEHARPSSRTPPSSAPSPCAVPRPSRRSAPPRQPASAPTLPASPASPAATSSTSASTSSSNPLPRLAYTSSPSLPNDFPLPQVRIERSIGSEVIQTSDHFCAHFGYQRSTPYMPHVSLLYGDLTDEEKEAARKKVEEMDSELSGLQFEISELALYRTDTEDKSLESWYRNTE
ncbi:hypothetical protein ACQ4PT_045352 [Festuca glaucescens]